jgi:hypothetical protein
VCVHPAWFMWFQFDCTTLNSDSMLAAFPFCQAVLRRAPVAAWAEQDMVEYEPFLRSAGWWGMSASCARPGRLLTMPHHIFL